MQAETSTEPLVYLAGMNTHFSEMSIASIRPHDPNRNLVMVSHTINGKPTLLFEYNDGEQYGIDVARLFAEVDAFHYANKEATTDKVAEVTKRKVSNEEIARNLDQYYGTKTALLSSPEQVKTYKRAKYNTAGKVHTSRKPKTVAKKPTVKKATKRLNIRKGKKG